MIHGRTWREPERRIGSGRGPQVSSPSAVYRDRAVVAAHGSAIDGAVPYRLERGFEPLFEDRVYFRPEPMKEKDAAVAGAQRRDQRIGLDSHGPHPRRIAQITF